MRHIELLAPAKNADVGIVAISHGADAVYIGADAFSARAAAGNSVADIKRLAEYGHTYGAKTIVALNTILNNEELRKAETLIWQLYEAGTDALIIQDLGILSLNLPPIPLHASTQTDNRTIDKVRLMHDLGMTRVVLARELSIDEIRAIHEAVPDVELECFIHGALCVCYSGQCYMSAAMTGRSANRGECAQPCRLPMELYGTSKLMPSEQGQRKLLAEGHLLSLRDMNRSAYIGGLIDAGVTSLKIEGRLKDASYVKNVVAYYRQAIDKAIEGKKEYGKASFASCYSYTFTPQLDKSFNRGFTDYFADGERKPMWNWKSPKSMGEKVGTIGKVGKDSFVAVLSTSAEASAAVELHNGDGLAVGDMGFRLNRVEGNTCYPLGGAEVCRQLKPKMPLYRNLDIKFEQLLDKPSSERRMPIKMAFESAPEKVMLSMELHTALGTACAQCEVDGTFDRSDKPQEENIRKQLTKLGNTPFTCDVLSVKGDRFVPSSILGDLRRQTVAKLQDSVLKMQSTDSSNFVKPDYLERAKSLSASGILPATYLANVMNGSAREVYSLMGIDDVAQAFELQHDKEVMVMQTKHCLKYALGQCKKFRNPKPEKCLNASETLGDEAILKIGQKKFLVKFGCKNLCVSKIFTIFAPEKTK